METEASTRIPDESDRCGAGDGTAQWIERFRGDVDRRYVSEEQVERTAALIDAIARSAPERGLSVVPPSPVALDEATTAKWPWPHLMVRESGGYLFSFHVAEFSRRDTAPKPRIMGGSVHRDGVPTWIGERSREFEATGQLYVRVDGDAPRYRQKSIRDTSKSDVEQRVGMLLDMLVEAAADGHAAAEEDARFELTVEQAQRACRGDRLYQAFCDEVRLHGELQRQRVYLDLVERRMHGMEQDDAQRVWQDIMLMREHIDARDPLVSGGDGWMDLPDPSDVDVFRYMHHGQGPSSFDCDRMREGRTSRQSRRPMPAIGDGGFFD